MKNTFHKATALLMALVVLFTTMSFTVSMHYCGEVLVDFSLNQKAGSCGMDSSSELVTVKSQTCEKALTSKTCCQEHQLVKKASQEFKTTFDKLSVEQQLFVATFTYSYLSLFEETASGALPFFEDSPPFVKRDLQILHQTFLI